ncbi:cell division cycle-associated protein 7 [Amborella trichopoda]|uniref:cell division cycle-associated protein 7 n=1 Tax=Amborella trichopoda TaxID=13333 RepID=UPI0005D4174E|nr:cell division cycle-associated protein 7 [Amborella trichopoda]|eukprot:XP_011628252.1 cell division cycle-associated protein 7 [Amborella trichopoda]
MGRLRVSDYEELRNARIKENQARLASLGLEKQTVDLKVLFSVTKSNISTTNKHCKRVLDHGALRRSPRLKDKSNEPKTPISHSKPDTGLVCLSEPAKRIYRRLKLRDSDGENEIRPANAPLVMINPTILQLSPEVLARRCDSKGRGSVYDPILGICCHFCRQKKLCGEEGCLRCENRDMEQPCLGKTDCSVCHSPNGVFCRACLKVRYGEEMEEVRENKKWMCPHCIEAQGVKPNWICNSSFCLKKRNIAPTGIAIFRAREMGYKSVAHFLTDALERLKRSKSNA